jgi:hypothetical protein
MACIVGSSNIYVKLSVFFVCDATDCELVGVEATAFEFLRIPKVIANFFEEQMGLLPISKTVLCYPASYLDTVFES